MEGYANVNSNHEDYDDLNIEGRNSTSDDWKKKEDVKPASQQESWRDLERRVLSLQVPLEDGTGQGYVFSFKLVSGVQRWRCHLCDVLVIGSQHVDTHIQSKKHQVKLALPSHPRTLFTRFEARDRSAVEVPALAPGEPVPPGFEDVVRRVAQIQATLDAYHSSPLIGLEYLVELTPEERGKEPMYVCMLCDKKGDPRVAMAHMTSFNHRSKYIGIHFPSASKLVATEFQSRKDNKKVMHLAINHLCSKIEEKFGRLKPLVAERDVFDHQRDQIISQIDREPHFSESSGDTMVELLDNKIIDSLIEEDAKQDAEPPKPDPTSSTVFNRGKISCDRSRLRTRTEEDTNPLEEENVFKKLAEMEKRATEALKEQEKEKAMAESKKAGGNPAANKKEQEPDTKSLSSISSISSSSLSLSRSPRITRSRSVSPPHIRVGGGGGRGGGYIGRRPFPPRERDRYRERSRWISPVARSRRRSRSRSRSRRSRSRSRSPRGRRPRRRPTRSRSRSRSRSPPRRRSGSPAFRKKGGASPPREKGGAAAVGAAGIGSAGPANSERRARENERMRWQKFRVEADRIEGDMIEKLKFHEKNPEKHPMYPEEWKKFWNRRYKELQAEGKDPAKHDFKPEWIEYWNRRMREMYDEELKNKKDEWRVRLGLPEEGEEPRPVRPKRKAAEKGDNDDIIVLSPVPGKEEKQSRKDVTVADIKNTWKALTGSDIKDPSSERRSPSPWEETEVPKRSGPGGDGSPPRGKWWHNNRGGGTGWGRGGRLMGNRGPIYEPNDGPGGVVHCLRMLTALENQLGSLGPQVNTLLAKALAMEKLAIDSSAQLLTDPIHCALFETSREKLKGQLYAGIVERNMVMATRSAVQCISALMNKADKMGPPVAASVSASAITRVATPAPVAASTVIAPLASPVATSSLLSAIPPAEPVVVPGIGTMDKVAIAQQIAEALVLQGKTDVSQEELETLINAVVGMAQASAASQEPISAATYAKRQENQLGTSTHLQTPLSIDTSVATDGKKGGTPSIGSSSPFTQLLSSVTRQGGSNTTKRPTALQILQSAYNESGRNSSSSNQKAGPFTGCTDSMDDLSEEDLKTLLQNFKELPSEEQYGLISYLKKVEAKEPERVERLRQFVNVGHIMKSPKKDSVSGRKQPNLKADTTFQNKLKELKSLHSNASRNERLSPFSLRQGGINPTGDERSGGKSGSDKTSKVKVDDSDDEDYSFEDIYAAASRKVKEREKAIAEENAKLEKEEKKKDKTPDDPRVLLQETKAIIANLMGQLPAKFIQKQSPLKESPSTPRKSEAANPSVAEGGPNSFVVPSAKPPMFNLANLQQSSENEGSMHSSNTIDNQYYPNYMDTNVPGGYSSQFQNQYMDQSYQEQPMQQNYPPSGYEGASYNDGGYYSSQPQPQPQAHAIPHQNFPQPQQYPHPQGNYGPNYSDTGIVNPTNQYQQPYQPTSDNYPTGYGQYSGQQGYY